jgi:hypothetical protein
MYAVDDLDRVVEARDFPQPDTSAPTPTVLADGYRCAVSYVTRTDAVWLIEFLGVESLMFGAPNDEALGGHPLAQRGLTVCSVARIERSSWVRALERMNSIHPEHDPSRFAGLTHFVFSFHDDTLEVVAADARVVGELPAGESIVARMRQVLSWPTV